MLSDCATSWTAACQTSLSFTISQSLLKLMSIELAMPSNYLILCHPLLLLRSIFHSIRVFSNELAVLKEISPGISLEGIMLKLKLQCFGHLMQRDDLFEKTLMLGKIEGGRRRG